MTRRADAQLSELRQQMTSLKPGVVENAVETAAPFLARIIGYAELASTFLPQIRDVLDRTSSRPAAAPRPVAAAQPVQVEEVVVPVRRRSWRMRGLAVALPLCAGLGAYAAWRFAPARRVRRRAPPG